MSYSVVAERRPCGLYETAWPWPGSCPRHPRVPLLVSQTLSVWSLPAEARRVPSGEKAIAGTVAHDHHNLIVIGADDASMETAARAVARNGGGLSAARGGSVLALLPLPVAGLMSDEPIESVAEGVRSLAGAARALGSPLRDPFMTMSFLGLEVVPALKLTDLGLVDVEAQAVVPLFTEK